MPATDALTEARRHLTDARGALREMREHTASLEALAGDRLSGEYLKQALYRRMMALRDDPDTPLFFGRIDYRTAAGADEDEECWIGRLHVTREMGSEPMVYDWRAPVSLPFYRASRTEPMGVALRRRFGFSHGALTAFEDERLTDADAAAESSFGHSDILESEIERPRTGPMRDIVATIQPEQDLIVRAPLEQSVVVQGAPGTGKTAVGLHRAAYLLYAHREQLSRSGVMVVGPNASFLSYIGDVLPALGEIDAAQETLESLVTRSAGRPVAGRDAAASAVLKGDPRMAEVLRRAVWDSVAEPTETLVVPRGSSQWRIPAHRCAAVIDELRGRGVRYAAGREMLAQRLAHQVLLRMEAAGESPDDRVQNAVARSRPVKAYVDAHWPALDAVKLVFRLVSDPDFLARHADGVLDADERHQVLIPRGRGVRTPRSAAAWRPSLADLVLIDEAADLLNRTPSLGHVILDEAQDLSAMGLRALGRRASTGSVTVLGDLAQATTAYATTSWADSLEHLGKPASTITELVAGFRVPRSVIEFAARLLPSIAPSLTPPHSVRRSAGDLRIVAGGPDVLATAAAAALRREGTVGVIVADDGVTGVIDALDDAGIEFGVLGEPGDEAFGHRLDIVPAGLAKGLEFDQVVLFEPDAIVAAEPDRITGLRRLYVCLTRAVSGLQVVHTRPLPDELAT